MSNAPIIVFAYTRLDHLRRTIESLRANPQAAQSALVIACDGPKREVDKAACDAVQQYAHEVRDGFQSIEVWASPKNRGLAASLTSGVSAMLQQHERVIVVEDDLEVSPYFLQYMNEGLDLYANEEQIAAIHGYIYPVRQTLPETFFLKGADCWGWATWRRAWRHFEPDGKKLLSELKARNLEYEFDLGNCYPYVQMLQDQIEGKNQSWAIRWQASVFLKGMLTLYPARSVVRNIGIDGSGTHSGTTNDFDVILSPDPIAVNAIAAEESAIALEAVRDFYRRLFSLRRRIPRAIRSRWHRWILRSVR